MHLTTKVSRPLAAPQIINDSSYPIVQGISDSVTASGKRPNSHEIQNLRLVAERPLERVRSPNRSSHKRQLDYSQLA